MREPRYSILSDINDGIDRAKQGKLALYWQRNIEHEYRCKKVTPAEQQAYTDLQDILAAVPQWSDEEELRSGMEGIGGRVWFCYFWEEHNSMVQLTEDCSGKFTVAYVLDSDVTPEVRKAAALHAQQQLAECMQEWDVPLMKSAIPEKDKYEYLDEAASHLMQGLHERGIPFILASASIKANVDFYFDSFPIGKWLKKEDVVYDDGTYADKGEMHLEAARRLNVPFSECMVIEDSVAAITLAKRNGAGQIVAIGEKADGSDLIQLGAAHYIHDFTEFDYAWLEN